MIKIRLRFHYNIKILKTNFCLLNILFKKLMKKTFLSGKRIQMKDILERERGKSRIKKVSFYETD